MKIMSSSSPQFCSCVLAVAPHRTDAVLNPLSNGAQKVRLIAINLMNS